MCVYAVRACVCVPVCARAHLPQISIKDFSHAQISLLLWACLFEENEWIQDQEPFWRNLSLFEDYDFFILYKACRGCCSLQPSEARLSHAFQTAISEPSNQGRAPQVWAEILKHSSKWKTWSVLPKESCLDSTVKEYKSSKLFTSRNKGINVPIFDFASINSSF